MISGTARTREEAFHHFVLAETEQGGRKVMNVWRDQPFYPPGGFVGRSMQRYKKDHEKGVLVPMGDSEAHKAWTQAFASADELCKEAIVATDRRKLQVSTVVLPMVVVPSEDVTGHALTADSPAGTPARKQRRTGESVAQIG